MRIYKYSKAEYRTSTNHPRSSPFAVKPATTRWKQSKRHSLERARLRNGYERWCPSDWLGWFPREYLAYMFGCRRRRQLAPPENLTLKHAAHTHTHTSHSTLTHKGTRKHSAERYLSREYERTTKWRSCVRKWTAGAPGARVDSGRAERGWVGALSATIFCTSAHFMVGGTCVCVCFRAHRYFSQSLSLLFFYAFDVFVYMKQLEHVPRAHTHTHTPKATPRGNNIYQRAPLRRRCGDGKERIPKGHVLEIERATSEHMLHTHRAPQGGWCAHAVGWRWAIYIYII